MSANSRLKCLLDKGFFPAELPPVFRTENFSSIIGSFSPSDKYSGNVIYFDGATFRGSLRQFGLINPVNFYLLSRFISDNWQEITTIYKLSKSSGSRPKFTKFSDDGRAIVAASIGAQRSSQQHLASSYPLILNLDINRFYGSVYTHSIPWAVLGKEEAKKQYQNHTLSNNWSDGLDRYVRNCNGRQTVGIPIGPDTSRIISELLLSRLDFELCQQGTSVNSGQIFHNIDDYKFGILNQNEAENTQSHFVRILSRYELRINDFKTNLEQGLTSAPSNFQRKFDVLIGQDGKKFIEHFFEILYELAAKHPNANVVGYALKRFARFLAGNAEKQLTLEYLQRLLYAAPEQARFVFPLILGLSQTINGKTSIKRLITWGVSTCARKNDVGSLLWYLYALLYLKIKLPKNNVRECLELNSPLVDLMLLHGQKMGFATPNISVIKRRYKFFKFNSVAWLLLYEVERHGWIDSVEFKKIGTVDDDGNLYETLKSKDVQFYSTENEYFTVEAFKGWQLNHSSFEDVEPFLDEAFFDQQDTDGWEIYE